MPVSGGSAWLTLGHEDGRRDAMDGATGGEDKLGEGDEDGTGDVQPAGGGQHASGDRLGTVRNQGASGQAAGEHAVRPSGGACGPSPGLFGMRGAAVRGHTAKFGIIAAKGITQVDPLLRKTAETDMPQAAKETLAQLGRVTRSWMRNWRKSPVPGRSRRFGGDDSRCGPVRIRPPRRGLARPDAEGAIPRQPPVSWRRQPSR